MEPAALRFDARDYLRVLLKRKWLIIVIAVAAMLLGGVYGVVSPKEYRASSLVLIRQQPKGIFWVTGDARPDETVEVGMETQAAIATSINTAERTAKRLMAKEGPGRITATAADIAASLTATVLPPDRIRIEATHVDRVRAMAFASETAATFCELSGDIRRTDERRAREFLEIQLDKTQADLVALGRRANEFRSAAGIVSATYGVDKLQDVLNGYRGQLSAAEAETAAVGREAASLREQLGRMRPYQATTIPVPNPAAEGLKKELVSNQIALTQLRARYTEDHPAVADMKARIEQIENEIRSQPTYVDSPAVAQSTLPEELRRRLSEAETRRAAGEARVSALRAAVRDAEAQVAQVASKQFQLSQFADEIELQKTTAKRMMEDLQAKRLSEAMKQGNALIIDHPVDAIATGAPVSRSALFGAILGLFCGLVVALAIEVLDDTIRAPEDLTRETGVSFLGMVPLLEGGPTEPITIVAPKSPPAEAYRTLRSNINFSLIDEPARTFLITSAGAGEGKSMTAANLAVVFAQSGQSVLLVDTDLRRATQHHIFNRESTRGITNALVGEMPLEDAIQNTDVEGLRLLASGPLPPNPAELLDSRRMDEMIERLKGTADIVIFDSPPAIVVSDAAILSSKVERTILVAEAGQVTRAAFGEMVRAIEHARGNVLGGVLNKLRLTPGDYYYYYYYYDYASSERSGGRKPTSS